MIPHDKGKPHYSVYRFLQRVIKPENQSLANLSRVIESFAQDIAFVVAREKALHTKHFLLSLGLESFICGGNVFDIIYIFGQCMS